VVICLERDADLHMAQLMPLPLTVSCFSKMQIGFTFLVPAHLGRPTPGQRAVKWVSLSLMTNHGQVLQPLLPDRYFTPYSVRERSHNQTLLNKSTHLDIDYFLIRMLYKDSC